MKRLGALVFAALTLVLAPVAMAAPAPVILSDQPIRCDGDWGARRLGLARDYVILRIEVHISQPFRVTGYAIGIVDAGDGFPIEPGARLGSYERLIFDQAALDRFVTSELALTVRAAQDLVLHLRCTGGGLTGALALMYIDDPGPLHE